MFFNPVISDSGGNISIIFSQINGSDLQPSTEYQVRVMARNNYTESEDPDAGKSEWIYGLGLTKGKISLC